MKPLLQKISQRRYIVLAVLFVLLWLYVDHRISQLDERFYQRSQMEGRFFQFSPQVAKGLLLYELGNYSGSAEAYRADLKESYETRDSSDDSAYDALARGDLQRAREISEKALKKNPSDLESLLILGEVFLENEENDNALKYFDSVLRIEIDQFDALLLSSVVFSRSGAYGKAIDSLSHALRHMKTERHDTSFLQALEITGELDRLPREKKPFCLLAHYFRYLRIYDDASGDTAIAYAQKAIEAGDEPDNAYLTMGIVYEKQGKRDQALSAFLNAVKINPHNPEALRWAGDIYSNRGDLIKEYQMRRAAFESAPEDPYYLDSVNYVMVQTMGDYSDALTMDEKLLPTQPQNAELYTWLGSINQLIGNDERAVEYYQKAILLRPSNTKNYIGIGYSLGELGRNKEAIAAFRKALSVNPGESFSHTYLGYFYTREHRYREAIGEYEAAIDMGDPYVDTVSLCRLYFKLADFENAVPCYRAALRRNPENTLARHEASYLSSLLK